MFVLRSIIFSCLYDLTKVLLNQLFLQGSEPSFRGMQADPLPRRGQAACAHGLIHILQDPAAHPGPGGWAAPVLNCLVAAWRSDEWSLFFHLR